MTGVVGTLSKSPASIIAGCPSKMTVLLKPLVVGISIPCKVGFLDSDTTLGFGCFELTSSAFFLVNSLLRRNNLDFVSVAAG